MKRKRFTEEQIAFALRQHEWEPRLLKWFARWGSRSTRAPTVLSRGEFLILRSYGTNQASLKTD